MSRPEQYIAIALQPAFTFAQNRAQVMDNIRNLSVLIDGAIWLASCQLPVRLVAIPEGVLQGFLDEVLDMPHSAYYDSIAIDIPGPETDALGQKAREHNTYIVCQARGRDPKLPGYYFNYAFIIDPNGDVIHKYVKLQVYHKEPSATPSDIYDRWADVYGWSLESLYPVADTPIGRIGTMVCYDGAFPEIARGLAMNGAEILYRPSLAEPLVGQEHWEVQNRARALDNACYLVAPNIGPANVMPEINYPLSVSGGKSMIVDYAGRVMTQTNASDTTYVAATIDIGSLREFRVRALANPTIKELATEQYRVIYDRPLREKNLYADDPNLHHADREARLERARDELIARGVWPYESFVKTPSGT